MKSRPDATEIKRQASGRWRDILPAITGIPSNVLDGRGHPCPACGGTDRFSVFSDFDETGGVICRGCHATDNADGLAAIQKFAAVDFPEACRLVAVHLGIAGDAPNGRKPDSVSTLARRTRGLAASVDVDRDRHSRNAPSDDGGETGLKALISALHPTPQAVYAYRNRHGVLVGAQVRLPDP